MLLLVSPMVWAGDPHPPVTISMSEDGDRKYQTIDGFGANINPDQWEHGHLRQAFDWLVDDLGGTLFRFDCFGSADWLDPNRRDVHGHFPAAYLKEVYTSRPYQNAWQALRYLTSKRVKVFLNVSGRIPAGLAEPDGNTLKDFAGVPKDTLKKSWTLYRTSRKENCVKAGKFTMREGTLELPLTEHSIFTLTALR